MSAIEAYVDTQRVYRFGAFQKTKSNLFDAAQWHIIELPSVYHGKNLYLRIFSSDPNHIGIPLIADNKGFYYDLVTNVYFLVGIVVVSCILMVSNLPMFAIKFKSASWAENQTQYIFIILSIFLLIILKLAAIPLIILMYILLSLVAGPKKDTKE